MTSVRLRAAALTGLNPAVAVPGYDRSAITAGIVHFGTGAFVRSHQATYLDGLMTAGEAADWGICAVDVLPSDRPKAGFFADQDGLYTVMVKNPDGTIAPRIIGSLAEYLFAPDSPRLVLDRLADPRTRIVTLTITEGGYSQHPVTGEFEPLEPAVAHDLEPGSVPRSVFGFIIAALRERRAQGVPPFTVVSCDNLQGNGSLARSVFSAFADRYEPGFGDWVAGHVAFPNSMVDRITPVTTAEDKARLRAEFGLDDVWPVVCEPFTQWVLEDQFPTGRPPWERCGVQLVADVTPYELMKLRLLNVGHQAMAYPGYLAGYRYAHEAVADPALAEFLTGYMQAEARPTLAPVPGVDLDDYIETLMIRFGNDAVRDTLARLCAASSDRIPKWLLPVIRHNLATGGPVARSAAIVASWARYAEGTDEAGQPIEVVDALRDEVMSRASRQGEDPLSFVRNEQLFGDLAGEPRFTEAYLGALAALHRDGAAATIRLVNAGLTAPDPAVFESPDRR